LPSLPPRIRTDLPGSRTVTRAPSRIATRFRGAAQGQSHLRDVDGAISLDRCEPVGLRRVGGHGSRSEGSGRGARGSRRGSAWKPPQRQMPRELRPGRGAAVEEPVAAFSGSLLLQAPRSVHKANEDSGARRTATANAEILSRSTPPCRVAPPGRASAGISGAREDSLRLRRVNPSVAIAAADELPETEISRAPGSSSSRSRRHPSAAPAGRALSWVRMCERPRPNASPSRAGKGHDPVGG
jgi:hypothetical protein